MSRRRAKTSSPPPRDEVRLVHAIPGRARLRAPARRGDAAWFERIAKELEGAPEVDVVESNATTASLLVLHHGEIDAILLRASEGGLFVRAPEAAAASEPQEGARAGDAAWQQAEQLFRRIDPRRPDGSVDLERVRALVFAALGALQGARGKMLPPGLMLIDEALRAWLQPSGATPNAPEGGGSGGPAAPAGSEAPGADGDGD
ncbi:MAG TPA: hypothetical protein VMW35_19105 [Myxococcota bacterium]|nr:hypothetical protein [Myxococcota bacterium]